VNDAAAIEGLLKGALDRELWVVTAAAGGRRGALTATWVSPVSVDPERPMLLAGLAPNHFTAGLVRESRAFAAHLLKPEQVEVAFRMAASSGRERDKLANLEVLFAESASPILRDCAAWFDCRVVGDYDAGDRLFFWADIVAADRVSAGPVLREQAFFGQLTGEQKQRLRLDLQNDLATQRPLHRQWREMVGGGTSIASVNP
jgi:flavin reductase (DIM6/NTAB) family NADH-FMN oxidoreductase RutF